MGDTQSWPSQYGSAAPAAPTRKSRHWSFVVRGGTIGGVEVFYSKRFDKLGEAGEH